MPDQLSLFALRLHALPEDPPDGTLRPLTETALKRCLHGPLIPPPGIPMLYRLEQQGLLEPHRHDSLTRLPMLRWAELMQNPEKLSIALLKKAKSKRAEQPNWLDTPWVENFSHRQLMSLVDWASRLRAVLSRQWYPGNETSSVNELNSLGLGLANYDNRILELESHPIQGPLVEGETLDPAGLLPGGEQRPLFAERAFLYALFGKLQTADALLQALLHAYLVIQNLACRFWLQSRHTEEGLERFVDDYVESPLQDLENDDRRHQLIQAHRTGNVHWLELRLAPGPKLRRKMQTMLESAGQILPKGEMCPSLFEELTAVPSSERPHVRDLRLPAQDTNVSRPGVGVILHFIKRTEKAPEAQPLGKQAATDCRHRKLRNELAVHRRQVEQLLVDPHLSPYIIGLDVASLETATPVEVFVPTLTALRQPFPFQEDFVSRLLRQDGFLERGPLGLTCHAGEEFHHLLGGMRTISETIHFLHLRAGDRLGHALAMGLEPVHWQRRVGECVRMKQGEHLDDLVWFYHRLAGMGMPGGLCRKLEHMISKGCRAVYEKSLDLELLNRAWEWRPEDPLALDFMAAETFEHMSPGYIPTMNPQEIQLERLLNPRWVALQTRRLKDARKNWGDDAMHIWHRYHHDPSVRKAYDAIIDAPSGTEWVEEIRAVQDDLILECAKKGIIVETNPTSNLCIGPLTDLTEHPIFRWRGPTMPIQEGCQVMVGSDDPSIFGSELLHEYGFLWAAAQKRGHSLIETQHWLQALRDAGLTYSFLPNTQLRS